MAKKKHNTEETPEEIQQPEAELEETTPAPEAETEDAPEAASPAEDSAAAAEETDPVDVDALQADLETARAQMQEYLDGWQRERAAFANYRRRVEEQQEQARRELVASIVKRYLEVLDDLELALKNKPAEGEGAAWAEGIELIYRKMLAILEAEGVKPIEAGPGTPFDPHFHEAITHEPHDERGSEEIIEVVRRGYMIDDQVLRPALVRVAQ